MAIVDVPLQHHHAHPLQLQHHVLQLQHHVQQRNHLALHQLHQPHPPHRNQKSSSINNHQ